MSFQEKNITVSLASFTLILVFYLVRLAGMLLGDGLSAPGVYWLWGAVVALSTAGTIAATIFTHIAGNAMRAAAGERPEVSGLRDERDQLIDLRGTSVAYRISSIGVALSMLTLVLGQPPLVMFSALIFFGLAAQIAADIVRLSLYRSGL
jgi:hypothetical protein